ncbi:MAG: carboxypeptidase regulatory-like domain-containing protein [bacterium]|nr:carboxypeptidase regulatory-like domain-containing protein [bacterium]
MRAHVAATLVIAIGAVVVLAAVLVTIHQSPTARQAAPGTPSVEPRSSSAKEDIEGSAATAQPDPLTGSLPEDRVFLHFPLRGQGACSIHGKVFDAHGNPMAGARTLLLHWSEEPRMSTVAETETLDDGYFRFAQLPNGHCWVVALKDDLSGGSDVRVWNTSEKYREGWAEIHLASWTSAFTTGTVVNADGHPVPGASVYALTEGTAPEVVAYWRPARTDEAGTYEFPHGWEGERSVYVRAPGYAWSELKDVRAGTDANDVALHRGGIIAGTVTDKETGAAASGVMVVASPAWHQDYRECLTDDAGRYALQGLHPDRDYFIAVVGEGGGRVAVECPKVKAPGPDSVVRQDLLLSQGATISGKVTVSDLGKPLTDVKLTLAARKNPFFYPRETLTDEDGAYGFSRLPAGPYVVKCEIPEIVRTTRDRHVEQKLEIEPEQLMTDADFRFEQGVVLSGYVKNNFGAPVADARVSARPVPHGSPVETRARADASFSLPGLVAGKTHTVIASADTYIPGELQIAVPETGGLADHDIIVEKGGSISGVVVDTRGRRVPECSVDAKRQSGNSKPWGSRSTEADTSGRFKFDGDLVPDTYLFSVKRRSGSTQIAMNPPVVVRRCETLADVTVVVSAAEDGRISGCVRAEDGMGMPGVLVRASNDVCRCYRHTDSQGRYALDGLIGESVDIRFQDAGFDCGEAKLTQVALGTSDANVTLYRYGTISGVVVSETTGEEVPDFQIATYVEDLYDRPFRRCQEGRVRSDGASFLIKKVDPGGVTLEVTTKAYPKHRVSGIELRPGQDMTGLTIRLPEPGVLTGHVLLNGARSPSGRTDG